MDKTITAKQLKDRGVRKGDIIHLHDNRVKDFIGWYLVISDKKAISLNTKKDGACIGIKQNGAMWSHLTHILLTEDIEDYGNKTHLLSEFIRDFNVNLVSELISEISHAPQTQYIKAVHFGNSKEYVWRVLEDCVDKFDLRVGEIVEVFTSKGRKMVEIREIYEDDLDEKYKIVNRVIQKNMPF